MVKIDWNLNLNQIVLKQAPMHRQAMQPYDDSVCNSETNKEVHGCLWSKIDYFNLKFRNFIFREK